MIKGIKWEKEGVVISFRAVVCECGEVAIFIGTGGCDHGSYLHLYQCPIDKKIWSEEQTSYNPQGLRENGWREVETNKPLEGLKG